VHPPDRAPAADRTVLIHDNGVGIDEASEPARGGGVVEKGATAGQVLDPQHLPTAGIGVKANLTCSRTMTPWPAAEPRLEHAGLRGRTLPRPCAHERCARGAGRCRGRSSLDLCVYDTAHTASIKEAARQAGARNGPWIPDRQRLPPYRGNTDVTQALPGQQPDTVHGWSLDPIPYRTLTAWNLPGRATPTDITAGRGGVGLGQVAGQGMRSHGPRRLGRG
jgi:hypothetical protein